MKRFNDLIEDCKQHVNEVFPWDVEDMQLANPELILVDVREPHEYDTMHVENSILAPRGVLETCCEYDFDETIPELAAGRENEILVICRSGNRSLLAARTMQLMGFQKIHSLKTGLRGWNESDLPLIDKDGKEIDPEDGDDFFASKLRAEQLDPARG
ncbi:MAG: rhodanese-like domain-containing protein [Gammaproteobacteria bacterium]|nr:rhodanese-like domain-containing protein [Gammaproteobacteria bacterium]